MRQFAFKINNRVYNLRLPWFLSGLSFGGKLLQLFDGLNTFFYFLFLGALPFSLFLYRNSGEETSVFFTAVLLILISVCAYTISLFLNHKYRVVDPDGVFAILIFALVTTLAAVLITPPETSNTFGTLGIDSHKGLSGLAVILYVGIFYLTAINVKKQNHFTKAISLLTTSSAAVLILYFLDNSLITANLFNLISLILLVFGFSAALGKRKILYSLPILLIGLSLFLKTEHTIETMFIIILTITLSLLPIYIIVVFRKSNELVESLNGLIFNTSEIVSYEDKKLTINKAIANTVLKDFIRIASLFVIPVLVLILLIMVAQDNNVLNPIESVFNIFSDNFTAIKDDIQNLLVGLGTSKAAELSNETLFTGALIGQGILGLFAYIFISLFGAFTSLKLLASNLFQNRMVQYRVLIVLTFIILFIPIVGFFTYPGIFLIIVWWVSISLVLALKRFNSQPENNISLENYYRVSDVVITRFKTSKNLSILMAFGLVIVTIILALILFDLRGSVI